MKNSRYIKVSDLGKLNYIVKVKLQGEVISINECAKRAYKAYKEEKRQAKKDGNV